VVIRIAVTSMLIFVNIRDVEAEEGIGDPGRYRRVREVGVDDEQGYEGEDDAEAEAMEAVESVGRPDDAITVRVEKVTVLLQNSLVRVAARPVVFGGTFGRLLRGCYVCARSSWLLLAEKVKYCFPRPYLRVVSLRLGWC
jgi:hypothetical protein